MRGRRNIGVVLAVVAAILWGPLALGPHVARGGLALAPQTPRLSSAEFDRRGNAVCRQGQETLKSLPKPRSYEQLSAQFNVAIRVYNTLVTTFTHLRPPQSMESDVKKMVAAFRGVGKGLQEGRDAARRGDQKALNASVKVGEKPARQAGELAYKLGLKDCVGTG
jgi:hypothetical protein